MASVYDRTDIYDLFDSPKKDAQTLSHWQAVFDWQAIRSALRCEHRDGLCSRCRSGSSASRCTAPI